MKYELVTWSESQEYMEEEWFDNESVLANEERFGSSAYFIPEKYIKKKPIQIIDFYDEEEIHGRISTRENVEKIEMILDRYREKKEQYNFDDFLYELEKKGIEFEEIPMEANCLIDF